MPRVDLDAAVADVVAALRALPSEPDPPRGFTCPSEACPNCRPVGEEGVRSCEGSQPEGQLKPVLPEPAPTDSDEQRARDVAWPVCLPQERQTAIAQALATARSDERERAAGIADRCRKEREFQLTQIPHTAVHRTAWVECKASEAKRIAHAIRERTDS